MKGTCPQISCPAVSDKHFNCEIVDQTWGQLLLNETKLDQTIAVSNDCRSDDCNTR